MYEGNDKFIPVPYSYYKISRETPSWENTTRREDSIKINIGTIYPTFFKKESEAYEITSLSVCLCVCAP
jgi:hypothetical protein